ncbi:hypothetical protein, partial [Streptomyces hygroscopicus]|uniref:hypothetical protein n=1 Tax=Streptomyces hygroscopicus TaxID=1912 RepID=UPI001F26226B
MGSARGRPAPLSTHTSSAIAGSSSASATATTSGKTTASRPTIRHRSRSPPASPPATRCRRRGQMVSRSQPKACSHHRATTARASAKTRS